MNLVIFNNLRSYKESEDGASFIRKRYITFYPFAVSENKNIGIIVVMVV